MRLYSHYRYPISEQKNYACHGNHSKLIQQGKTTLPGWKDVYVELQNIWELKLRALILFVLGVFNFAFCNHCRNIFMTMGMGLLNTFKKHETDKTWRVAEIEKKETRSKLGNRGDGRRKWIRVSEKWGDARRTRKSKKYCTRRNISILQRRSNECQSQYSELYDFFNILFQFKLL